MKNKTVILTAMGVTLTAMAANAYDFGTGNIYDKYIACHRKNNAEQTAQKDLENTIREGQTDGKLKPENIPAKTTVTLKKQEMVLKYGVPYPRIKPKKDQIIETRYGIPYPKDNIKPFEKEQIVVPLYAIPYPTVQTDKTDTTEK